MEINSVPEAPHLTVLSLDTKATDAFGRSGANRLSTTESESDIPQPLPASPVGKTTYYPFTSEQESNPLYTRLLGVISQIL
jgi:hypothetical protein